jgi:hypothetical protein
MRMLDAATFCHATASVSSSTQARLGRRNAQWHALLRSAVTGGVQAQRRAAARRSGRTAHEWRVRRLRAVRFSNFEQVWVPPRPAKAAESAGAGAGRALPVASLCLRPSSWLVRARAGLQHARHLDEDVGLWVAMAATQLPVPAALMLRAILSTALRCCRPELCGSARLGCKRWYACYAWLAWSWRKRAAAWSSRLGRDACNAQPGRPARHAGS